MKILLFAIPIAIIILTIPILIGIYVYRDAKSRGMNAKRATLIAVFAPCFIGFIIYLLTRNERSKRNCPNCFAPAQDSWRVCPQCAAPLPEINRAPTQNYNHDKMIGKILLLTIIVPIVLIIVTVFAIEFYPDNNAKSIYIQLFTIEEFTEKTESEKAIEWLENAMKDKETVSVLKYKSEIEDTKQIRVRYLAYIPMLSDEPIMSHEMIEKMFSDSIDIGFDNNGEASGNIVVLINYRAAKEPKLNLIFDGEALEYEIAEAEEPIDFFIHG